MSVSGLLQTVVSRLNSAGIPYMLTGSMAAAIHGAGRATLDIDVVIEADAERLRELVASLSGPEFYVSDDAVMDAIAHESMFNVVEVHTGWKADLIIRKSRPFSESEFARRRPVVLDDIELWVVCRGPDHRQARMGPVGRIGAPDRGRLASDSSGWWRVECRVPEQVGRPTWPSVGVAVGQAERSLNRATRAR